MHRLPVNLDDLAAQFDQPRRGPVRAFFDRTTGDIEVMPRDAEVEGVFDDILSAPARWIEIQPLPLDQRQALRRRFVDETISDPHQRLRLAETLAEGPPFTRFEATLRAVDALDAWMTFRASTLTPLLQAWLSALDVEAL